MDTTATTQDSSWGDTSTPPAPRKKPTPPNAPTMPAKNVVVALLDKVLAQLAKQVGDQRVDQQPLAPPVADMLAVRRRERIDLEQERDQLVAALNNPTLTVEALTGDTDTTISAGEVRLSEITKRLSALNLIIARLQDTETVARHRDVSRQAVIHRGEYLAALNALDAALAAAEVAFVPVLDAAKRLHADVLDLDHLESMATPDTRPLLRRPVDSSCLVLAWEWRNLLVGDGHGNKAVLVGWREQLDQLRESAKQ